ncbi:hypothetical protein GJ699_14915 [Duganella sp. FT80W]|jgi:hypothetical protein|uniref:Type II secretion system protein GspE N-terminal domain-containing protein n=1 Tax=Duganella guangzhouensis TaxID=2666084 RepID=A0A6I2L062_9BURK|nr:hypothetical protein [Duganella guangzhouensis]MRW91283.1 hypothetical protein [Duganella guangzhouensis]
MGWLSNNQNKSMLGQLLVRQKLITEEQLANAIALQRQTGQRLGDIFAELNLITQQHIEDALRKQRRLRMAAAIAASLLAPLETYAASALPAAALTASAPVGVPGRALRALTEEELGDTSAQGLSDDLVSAVKHAKSNNLEVVGEMSKLLNPVLGFLEADTTMKNVVYDPSKAAATINKDGTLTLSLPSSIGEIAFNNIRVRGTEGSSFGSISIKGIDLSGTSITVGFR